MHTPGIFRLQVVRGDWPADAAENLDTANVSGRQGQPISYEVTFQLQAVGSATRVDGLAPGAPEGVLVKLIGANRALETRLAADASFAFNDLAAGAIGWKCRGWACWPMTSSWARRALPGHLPLRSKLAGSVTNGHDGLVAVLFASAPMNWTRQAPLDATGKFAFEKLPPGRYRLEVGDVVISDIEMTGENSLTLSPIDLTQGQRSVLRGQVADGGGRPQANTMVLLRRKDGVVANMPTDAQGTYKFSNLPPGAYSLEVAGMGEVGAGIRLDGENEQVRDVLWRPRGTAWRDPGSCREQFRRAAGGHHGPAVARRR